MEGGDPKVWLAAGVAPGLGLGLPISSRSGLEAGRVAWVRGLGMGLGACASRNLYDGSAAGLGPDVGEGLTFTLAGLI